MDTLRKLIKISIWFLLMRAKKVKKYEELWINYEDYYDEKYIKSKIKIFY